MYSSWSLPLLLLSFLTTLDWTMGESKHKGRAIKTDCDKKFQNCLDRLGDTGHRKGYKTPRDCNTEIQLKDGCAAISEKRIERVPNKRGETRWRLVRDRNLIGISIASDSSTTEKPTDHSDDGIQINSKSLHSVANLQKKLVLS